MLIQFALYKCQIIIIIIKVRIYQKKSFTSCL